MVLRAIDQPTRARDSAWRDVVHSSVIPMDVRLSEGAGVQDKIVIREVGPIRVIECDTGPGHALRTPRQAALSTSDLLGVFVHLRGRALGEHAGRRAVMRPGDIGLLDPAQPFRCEHDAHSVLIVAFPVSLLPLPRADVTRLSGARIPADRGPARLASSFIRQLSRHDLADTTGATRARLGTTVVDLLAAAFADRLDPAHVPDPAQEQVLLTRIYAFIEAKLGDPDLGPATLAAAHHISLRYLYTLFEKESTTVAAWIQRRRLDRSRRDLLDPALRATPVSAVARRNGFRSTSHFSRAFRAVHGLPPAQYRLVHTRLNGQLPDHVRR